jgi:hypothetical protein
MFAFAISGKSQNWILDADTDTRWLCSKHTGDTRQLSVYSYQWPINYKNVAQNHKADMRCYELCNHKLCSK